METHKGISHKNQECWRRARDLTVNIYRLVSDSPLNFDQELKEALTKTTVSVMSHIAMGNEQSVQTEFIKHLRYARISLVTLRTYLVIIRELGYIGEGDFLDFDDQSIQIAVFIDNLIKKNKVS